MTTNDKPDARSDLPALLRRLRLFLPAHCLLVDEEDLRPYECDGLTAYRELPLVVCLPETEGQVIDILRTCHDLGVPVVARGAGTGLSGGAMPHAQGVVLSLARFNRILRIDREARLAVVQPGVRNLAVSEAAAPFGLYYAPDPSSQIACTLGGNVAENSGGVHCLKYGLTVHNVLRIRVVSIEGEVFEIGSEALDAPGYDLLALMIGSEGMLGVVTEVTVKLVPKPELAQVVMASFADVAQAGDAVAAIIGAGDIRVSQSEAERLKFWAGRKAAFPAVGRITPDYYCMDGTIPRKRLAEMLSSIAAMERKYGLRCANVFHAGDGNLHPLIMYDAAQPGNWERAEAFGAEILELSVALGGSITGEHGVGIEKINQMCVQYATPELEAFHRVKAAFDERGLLNPGKAVPSLHRCAEYGRMHVHRGELKFPELERF